MMWCLPPPTNEFDIRAAGKVWRTAVDKMSELKRSFEPFLLPVIGASAAAPLRYRSALCRGAPFTPRHATYPELTAFARALFVCRAESRREKWRATRCTAVLATRVRPKARP